MADVRKVFLVTNIPTPYRIPLFNLLANRFGERSIEFKVIFAAGGYSRRKWKIHYSECDFEYVVLNSKKCFSEDPENTTFTYDGLMSEVKKERPDIVIVPGYSLATMKLWLYSWIRNTPFVIWTGSMQSGVSVNTKGFLRDLQRKLINRRAGGFIAYGSKTRDYLVKMGVRSEKIKIAINSVDTEYFGTSPQNGGRKKQDKTKGLLYVGYLVKRKRVDQLLTVVRALSIVRNDFLLKIVGEGPELSSLKELASRLSISELVQFEGYKQKEQIPFYLREADCFLLPTEFDIWGLSIVEAMAAGLPCISSIHAGVAADLVHEGLTGFQADFSDTSAVCKKINWVLDNPQSAKEIGAKASQFIKQEVNLTKSSDGFLQAVLDTPSN